MGHSVKTAHQNLQAYLQQNALIVQLKSNLRAVVTLFDKCDPEKSFLVTLSEQDPDKVKEALKNSIEAYQARLDILTTFAPREAFSKAAKTFNYAVMDYATHLLESNILASDMPLLHAKELEASIITKLSTEESREKKRGADAIQISSLLGKRYDDVTTACAALKAIIKDTMAQNGQYRLKELQKICETTLALIGDKATTVDSLKSHFKETLDRVAQIDITDMQRSDTSDLEEKIKSTRAQISCQQAALTMQDSKSMLAHLEKHFDFSNSAFMRCNFGFNESEGYAIERKLQKYLFDAFYNELFTVLAPPFDSIADIYESCCSFIETLKKCSPDNTSIKASALQSINDLNITPRTRSSSYTMNSLLQLREKSFNFLLSCEQLPLSYELTENKVTDHCKKLSNFDEVFLRHAEAVQQCLAKFMQELNSHTTALREALHPVKKEKKEAASTPVKKTTSRAWNTFFSTLSLSPISTKAKNPIKQKSLPSPDTPRLSDEDTPPVLAAVEGDNESGRPRSLSNPETPRLSGVISPRPVSAADNSTNRRPRGLSNTNTSRSSDEDSPRPITETRDVSMSTRPRRLSNPETPRLSENASAAPGNSEGSRPRSLSNPITPRLSGVVSAPSEPEIPQAVSPLDLSRLDWYY